jgi:hypothetical protein
MDTDSCEFDAAEKLLTPYLEKHRTTDKDVGPSKRRKYDENYIDLGFTYIGSMCKSSISQLDETFTLAQTFRNNMPI